MSRRDNFSAGRGSLPDYAKGAPGNYVLNQKSQKFGDRRTKRNRDRSTNTRNAISRSKDDE